MKTLLVGLLGGVLSGLIVAVGIVSWSYMLTGDWPSQYLLTSASIGGAISPLFWSLIRRFGGDPAGPKDEPR